MLNVLVLPLSMVLLTPAVVAAPASTATPPGGAVAVNPPVAGGAVALVRIDAAPLAVPRQSKP